MSLELMVGDKVVYTVEDAPGYGPVTKLVFNNGHESSTVAVPPGTVRVYMMIDRPNPGDPVNLLQLEQEQREADQKRREGQPSVELEGVPENMNTRDVVVPAVDATASNDETELGAGEFENA